MPVRPLKVVQSAELSQTILLENKVSFGEERPYRSLPGIDLAQTAKNTLAKMRKCRL